MEVCKWNIQLLVMATKHLTSTALTLQSFVTATTRINRNEPNSATSWLWLQQADDFQSKKSHLTQLAIVIVTQVEECWDSQRSVVVTNWLRMVAFIPHLLRFCSASAPLLSTAAAAAAAVALFFLWPKFLLHFAFRIEWASIRRIHRSHPSWPFGRIVASFYLSNSSFRTPLIRKSSTQPFS